MQSYPTIKPDATAEQIARIIALISRIREQDINDYNNLPLRFMSGRKVGKIPASSADISSSDYIGDFNFDSSFFYICIGLEWRRIALGSW